MPRKIAACEPCRLAKVGCDHGRPICTRCREYDKVDQCEYRDRPFKRKRNPHVDHSGSTDSLHDHTTPAGAETATPSYPNPGFLGTSSHKTIFEQLSPPEPRNNTQPASDTNGAFVHRSRSSFNNAHVGRAVHLLEQIRSSTDFDSCEMLIHAWLAKGVNLALAGSFVKPCSDTSVQLFSSNLIHAKSMAIALLERSSQPVITDRDTTLESFVASFCWQKPRWETLGFFFTAVTRASTEFACHVPLYDTREGRRRFQQSAVYLADCCLELALSLDCLNDLQLILQYENFITHSIVNGDQSYLSWRRLGDVVSSLFALGYHEQAETGAASPPFLRDLRRSAFARAYSADKNVSIFLGRPPRIHQKYCRPQLSEYFDFELSDDSQFNSFDYHIDTAWTAKCAILKERILDMGRTKDYNERLSLADEIQNDADAQWSAFPRLFRLETALKLCDRKAIERDFMVSARLNHLHVLFLLRLAMVQGMATPDDHLISISASMLSLAVDSLILRDQLANSGTGLAWRISYYALPAAGIICLCLLNKSGANASLSMSSVVQDLNVLVAQIESGALVHFDDPNYALLSEATRSIKTLLNKIISWDMRQVPKEEQLNTLSQTDPSDLDPMWVPWTAEQDIWDFETDFWLNLVEHPALNEPNGQLVDFLL